MSSRQIVRMFAFGWMMLAVSGTFGQTFPDKPIRIIANEAGGGGDLVTRLIAHGISGPLGQQVIVDNRPTTVMSEMVAKAPADGHTLLYSGSPLWILPLMRTNAPWDPVKDFSPISLTASYPNVLVVHPSLPVRSVKELIALAKARPGELNYGSGGLGSNNFLVAELFKAMAGVNIVHVPYKGGASAVNAVIGGEVQVSFTGTASVTPHVNSGKLRPLAVTSSQPSALMPGVPTVAATVPGYESVAMLGIFAPAKTPVAIINRLNQEIVRVLNTPDAKERILNAGLEVVASSPEQFSVAMKSDMARLGKVIKDTGIKAD